MREVGHAIYWAYVTGFLAALLTTLGVAVYCGFCWARSFFR